LALWLLAVEVSARELLLVACRHALLEDTGNGASSSRRGKRVSRRSRTTTATTSGDKLEELEQDVEAL